MQPAARLHDPIDHSRALGGLIAGALIGGAIATVVVLTAPVSVPVLIGGAAIAGAAVGGAGVGELLGSLSPAMHRTGEIARPGAPNVWANKLAAARAHLDHVACDDHGAAPVIAQGSDSVFVNNQPLARKGDHTACDAVIADGSPNVWVGGGTATTDAISPEVPGYVHTTMLAVGLASATILAGPVVAAAGLVGGIVGGKLGSALGGAWFGEGSDGQKILAFGGAVLGGGLAGKGGAWFDRNYTVQSEGLGANGGNLRIARRPPPAEDGTESFPYSPKKMGQTEPGAVPNSPELQAQMDAADLVQGKSSPGYPDLPPDVAKTFGDDVRPWDGDNHPGGSMERVIGADKSANGSFWQDKVPDTEAEWRGGSAVLNDWNGNGGYVESPTAGLKGWTGSARPQMSSDGVNVLPGQGQQIWIEGGTANPGPTSPTPWSVR